MRASYVLRANLRRRAAALVAACGSMEYYRQAARSDPAPTTRQELEELARAWTLEEEHPGYVPPSASWPRKQPRLSHVPLYRDALSACTGGIDNFACHEAAFTLATALLGGALFGHSEHADEEEANADQQAEGLALLHALTERGCPNGACGLGFCLLDGPGGLDRDEQAAAVLFEKAAHVGQPQAMCELATMFWLGDGVPEDATLAQHWFHRGANAGVPAAMFLFGECLLAHAGDELTSQQAEQRAVDWFVAAGRLGHRGARSRVITAVCADDAEALAGRYGRAAGRRGSEWSV